MSLRFSSERISSVMPARLAARIFSPDAAHGHHAAAEGRFARHGDTLPHLASGVGRDDRGHHRDTGRRPVLRNRPLRHVDIDVVLLERRSVDSQLRVVGHHPLVGDRRRLLHHLAQITRQADFCPYRESAPIRCRGCRRRPRSTQDPSPRLSCRPLRTPRGGTWACRESSRRPWP